MKFKIDNKIFKQLLGLNIGVLICRGINNHGEAEEIIKLIRQREGEIREQLNSKTLSQHPKISVWREVYHSFGVKPKEYKSSVEALYKRILKGDELRHINKIVDIYNYISLKHTVPVGGEDLNKIQGDIFLTFAGSDESPVLLLGDKEEKSPRAGEIIYKDEVSAICRRFNWREADRTKFTEETKNAIVVIEGLPPTSKKGIEQILEEAKNLIQNFCGGKIDQFLLNRNNSKIEF